MSLTEFKFGLPYGSHLPCTNWLHSYLAKIIFLPYLGMSSAVTTCLLSFNFAYIICFPRFIGSPCRCVWRALHRLSPWTCTILGFMTKATIVIASHGVTLCRNIPNMVTDPTSNCVIGTSSTSSSMECTFHILLNKTITWIAITIESMFIPGYLVPLWRWVFSEFAPSRTNSLISSKFSIKS